MHDSLAAAERLMALAAGTGLDSHSGVNTFGSGVREQAERLWRASVFAGARLGGARRSVRCVRDVPDQVQHESSQPATTPVCPEQDIWLGLN